MRDRSWGSEVVWRVEIENRCLRELKKLDRLVVQHAFEVIENVIAMNPYTAKALAGRYRGLYSYRFSSYRIVYELRKQRLVIVTLSVSHQKDVYEGL
jgi:addiction module RelE/StbE family toxin